jgi:hypothetical protein
LNLKSDVENANNPFVFISGYWTEKIFYNKIEIWNSSKGPYGYLLERNVGLLASDSIFRKDKIYLKFNKLQKAETARDSLEEQEEHF